MFSSLVKTNLSNEVLRTSRSLNEQVLVTSHCNELLSITHIFLFFKFHYIEVALYYKTKIQVVYYKHVDNFIPLNSNTDIRNK